MIYGSLAQQVEQTLAQLAARCSGSLPHFGRCRCPSPLAAAGPGGEEEALAQVVRRYFLSSIGDDAAYKLACLALDRHDFVGASRLLIRSSTSHPDPSIAKADLLTRLAVAGGRTCRIDKQPSDRSSSSPPRPARGRQFEITELISLDVKSAPAANPPRQVPSPRPIGTCILGSAARTGAMPALPAAATSRTLSELWVREFPLEALPLNDGTNDVCVRGGASRPAVSVACCGRGLGCREFATRRQFRRARSSIAQWRAGGWRPTGRRALRRRPRIFEDARPARLLWGRQHSPISPFGNRRGKTTTNSTALSQQLAMMAAAMGGNLPQPSLGEAKDAARGLLFGDRVHQSLAIADGVVYSLEGKRIDERRSQARRRQTVSMGHDAAALAHQLAHGLSGQRRQGPLDPHAPATRTKTGTSDVGFLAAPTPCGSLLLAPVTDGGTMWLFGLDRATGKTAMEVLSVR